MYRLQPLSLDAQTSSRWLDSTTRWSLAVLLGAGLSSLGLAMAGRMTPWLALPATAATSILLVRWLPSPRGGPSRITALGALIVVGVVAGFGIAAPHEHILTTRDSGTYVATAAWLINHGGLRMDVTDPTFDDVTVIYESVGFPARDADGFLQPQFLHMFPSLLSLAGGLGFGSSLMYWISPISIAIGLLSFFALARGLLAAWPALGAMALLAVTMPFVYFSRAPFTESLAFALLFGGLWVLREALEQVSPRLAVGAGLLFGGLILTRIDGVVILLGLVAYRTILQLRGGGPVTGKVGSVRLLDKAIGVGIVFFIISILDLYLFSLQYLVDHGAFVAAVVAVVLILLVLGRLGDRLTDVFVTHGNAIANSVSGAIGLFLAYAWLARPDLEAPTRPDSYGLEGLQQAAGVEIEPLRSYAELSVHWLSWYLGIPLVALGLIGMVILVRRVLLDRDAPDGPFVGVMVVSTVLYVYRPSINPDHIWAMRRFVPLVVPALILVAVGVSARLVSRSGRWATPAAVTLAAMLVLPVVITTANVGLGTELDGAAGDVVEACETLGVDAALVFVGEASQIRHDALGPLIRGSCDIPVAVEDPDSPLDAADIERMATAASAIGRSIWIVGGSDETGTTVNLFDASFEYLELTLFEAPSDWLPLNLRLRAARAS